MKRIILILTIFGFICTNGFQAQSQTVEQLRIQRKEIQERINAINCCKKR